MAKSKKPKCKVNVSDKKIPKSKENPNSFYEMTPKWAFSYFDFESSEYGFYQDYQKNVQFFQTLKSFEGMKWREIFTTTSGRPNNTRNHSIAISKISIEAQKRIRDMNLIDVVGDELYSLAISSLERVWGTIIDGVFFIIWIDKKHKIYEVSK